MKNRFFPIFTLVVFLTMFSASSFAQIFVLEQEEAKNLIEVYKEDDEKAMKDKDNEEDVVDLRQPEKQNITIDRYAPLGGELLLLGCLGGAYLIGKKRKEEK